VFNPFKKLQNQNTTKNRSTATKPNSKHQKNISTTTKSKQQNKKIKHRVEALNDVERGE